MPPPYRGPASHSNDKHHPIHFSPLTNKSKVDKIVLPRLAHENVQSTFSKTNQEGMAPARIVFAQPNHVYLNDLSP